MWVLGSRNRSKGIFPVSGVAESMRKIDLCIGLLATIARLRSVDAITMIDPASGLSNADMYPASAIMPGPDGIRSLDPYYQIGISGLG